MEAEKDKPLHAFFSLFSNTKDKLVQIFFPISRNMYFNSFLKYFLEKNICFRAFKHIFL